MWHPPSWHWLRDHRRKKILETPFPPAWQTILEKDVAHYRRLGDGRQREFRDLVQVFVAEKNWEGCGGLTLTDEMRVIIAAEACLMILALPHDVYRKVKSILIYPSTVLPPERKPGVFEQVMNPLPAREPILGEATRDGVVLLVWDSVLRSARHPEAGPNVVYHEFAHQLDMLDGGADGTPPLESRRALARWVEVCSRVFTQLRADAEAGRRTFLRPYAARNDAEFFAVVTEAFFDRPVELRQHHAELYGVLKDFYGQDPASPEP